MPGIDETQAFHPLRIAVLTVSDTRDEERDSSGRLLVERLAEAGHELAGRAIVPDDVGAIQRRMPAWVADERVDVIISTGGTGSAAQDVTPEAPRPLFDREMDGFSVLFHQASLARSDSRRFSRVPVGDRSAIRLFSAFPARPAPAGMAGILFWARQPLSPLLAGGEYPALWESRRMSRFSHVDAEGRPRMVDVTDKSATNRRAIADGQLICLPEPLEQVRAGTAPKRAVVQTAEIAGMMAAKRTAELTPLCHPLSLTSVAVTIELDDGANARTSSPARRCRSERTGSSSRRMSSARAISRSSMRGRARTDTFATGARTSKRATNYSKPADCSIRARSSRRRPGMLPM